MYNPIGGNMSSQLIRKQIYIQKRQDILLKRLSKARGVSEAEIIRQAIEREFRGEVIEHPAASALEDFIQLALEKRLHPSTTGTYHWSREDIYDERVSRLIKDQEEQ